MAETDWKQPVLAAIRRMSGVAEPPVPQTILVGQLHPREAVLPHMSVLNLDNESKENRERVAFEELVNTVAKKMEVRQLEAFLNFQATTFSISHNDMEWLLRCLPRL
jgi:hypothetical protein